MGELNSNHETTKKAKTTEMRQIGNKRTSSRRLGCIANAPHPFVVSWFRGFVCFQFLAWDRTSQKPGPIPYPAIRSASAKTNTVTLITPFIVKNAASSRERLPGRTSRCS
jgi:hypothetical protein